MMKLYFASLPVLVLLLIYVPINFWILPEWLVESNALVDGAFALFVYSSSVFGGWLQLYNLADRGLSLRILIDALDSGGSITISQLSSNYGAGKGIQWMYEKRLADIERIGLVSRSNQLITLSEKGTRNSKLIILLRRIYALSPSRDLKKS